MSEAAETVPPDAQPMKPWRMWLVYGVVGVIVLGHVYEIVRQQEHWPFTNYEMWAKVTRDWHVSEIVPVGVSDEPEPREVDLRNPAYFAPMPLHYQRLNFRRAASREKLRDRMIEDYLRRYEFLRSHGKHNGPPLKGLRLYEWYWLMDRSASNAQAPDRRTLLYQYPAGSTRPSGGGQ
jgi:hypothetical protein